jgi:molecular chaperone DnaK
MASFHVLARDTATQRDVILEIENTAVDVADEKVERMISESVDHAFEDMNERIWTEARLKAEELLPAVDQALDQLGAELSSEESPAHQNVRCSGEEPSPRA